MCYVLLAIYILWIIFLLLRLRDIKRNPKKFDVIPGYDKYEQSEWYWPPKKMYGKTDPPDACGAINGIAFILISGFLELTLYLIISFSRPSLPHDGSTIRFVCSRGGPFVILAVFIVLSISLSDYLLMFSKKPMAICWSVHHIFRTEDRSVAWKRMTVIVLIASLIACPFHVLAVKDCGYADDEKIIFSPYLSLRDKEIKYDEIREIKIVVEDEKETHCFLTGSNGEQIDLYGKTHINDSNIYLKDFVFSRLPSEILQEKVEITSSSDAG